MMFSPTGRHRAPRRRSGAGRLLTRASTAAATLALPVVGASVASAADGGTYTVAPGDSLSEIAAKHRVEGGWSKLYASNRAAVGGNPDLIKVGTKLKLSGTAAKPKQRAARSAERPAVRAAAGDAVRPVSGGALTAGFGAGEVTGPARTRGRTSPCRWGPPCAPPAAGPW